MTRAQRAALYAEAERLLKLCGRCGSALSFTGLGAYPWDCISKEKHPNAPVYGGCTNQECRFYGIGYVAITPDAIKLRALTIN